jgi:hypothetical protein
MNGTDIINLTMVLQKADSKQNSDHVVFFDTPDASKVMVRGFNRYEQYANKLSKSQLEVVTTLCEWDDNAEAWTVKMNATLPASLRKWKT